MTYLGGSFCDKTPCSHWLCKLYYDKNIFSRQSIAYIYLNLGPVAGNDTIVMFNLPASKSSNRVVVMFFVCKPPGKMVNGLFFKRTLD